MSNDTKPDTKPPSRPSGDRLEAEDSKDAKKGLFGRLGAAIQNSRGTDDSSADLSLERDVGGTGGDLALRRTKDASPKRMVIPEGATLTGSLVSSAETEISGRIDGDVAVESRLYLGPGAVVTGTVRAGSCKIEGLVEGKVECSQELELSRTGRVNSDASSGRKITVAGQIYGTVAAGGVVRIVNSGKIEGNINAKQVFIEEGAKFNGRCTMRPPADKRPVAKAPNTAP